ncbi:MAG: ComF family protein [Terriglobia bacterium]
MTSATRIPVCPGCWGRVRPLELVCACALCQRPLSPAPQLADREPLCGLCRRGLYHFGRLRSFGAFDGALRDLLHLFKYNRVTPLARPLARLLAGGVHQEPALRQVDAVVPVPLHPRRERARGYNQAELLARELARELALPLEPSLLARIRDTASQTGLTPRQRRENVRGAFAVPAPSVRTGRPAASQLKGKRILLIDDVATTGATLSACARTLKRAGAAAVAAATVARVVEWTPPLSGEGLARADDDAGADP